ncbi:MAG: hypothetical protein N4J56_007906 [Chroococcidiopsis sp. SAG 2025]|uniref:hypothetical protein n=1 Tax=Chroococcidiopsis sp. SAG 2025 TaxID=171389 RepID=UPI00293711BD|nr:hypothetical protein [Chroococcidiopsis sp. SAG 2025]MDV2998201.1 hypothetical protein [Chroococcidiopsis sp. SAG 2025]
MSRRMHRNSLANLNPRNRDQGKVRLNTTLKPETIAWLQAGGNASGRIEELVALAKSENTHKQEISDSAHEQKKSDDTHERKALENRLCHAEEKLSVIADIVRRWEKEVGNRKASSPRWENVVRLLSELRTDLQNAKL